MKQTYREGIFLLIPALIMLIIYFITFGNSQRSTIDINLRHLFSNRHFDCLFSFLFSSRIFYLLVEKSKCWPCQCQFSLFFSHEYCCGFVNQRGIHIVVLSEPSTSMSRIISIGTALPSYRHRQHDILDFMLHAYQPEAEDRRKISLLYERSGIDTRYAVIPDYSVPVNERILLVKVKWPELSTRIASPALPWKVNLLIVTFP